MDIDIKNNSYSRYYIDIFIFEIESLKKNWTWASTMHSLVHSFTFEILIAGTWAKSCHIYASIRSHVNSCTNSPEVFFRQVT
jgi:hypothetical protein